MQLENRPNWRGVAQLRMDGRLLFVDVGGKMNRTDVHRGARLKVDGLPDSLGLAVTLFALEFERMRRVVHAKHERLLLPPLNMGGQFELERRVTTAMFAERVPAEPAFGEPIARPDHQKDAFSPPRLRHLHPAPVPGDVGPVLDTGQSGTPRKRHLDSIWKRGIIGGPSG